MAVEDAVLKLEEVSNIKCKVRAGILKYVLVYNFISGEIYYRDGRILGWDYVPHFDGKLHIGEVLRASVFEIFGKNVLRIVSCDFGVDKQFEQSPELVYKITKAVSKKLNLNIDEVEDIHGDKIECFLVLK